VGKAAVKFIAGCALALGVAFGAIAQQQPGADAPSAKAARPLWSELSPKQQAVLAPIASEWDKLDTTRRKKWVTIANRYPKMTPDEQQRLQARMQDWVSLTPAQRRVARENYQSLKQLPYSQRGDVRQKLRGQQKPETEATPAAADAPAK
jgi:hypothetical protein